MAQTEATAHHTVELTAEAKAAFDYTCRHYLNISGEEFLRQYDSGKYTVQDLSSTKLKRVISMLPFAR